MAGRFVLILSIAKLLSAEELGLFGLLSTTIGFFVLLFGFDFYGYANREMLAAGHENLFNILINQLYAYIPLYMVFMPFAIGVFWKEVLPWSYAGWFLTLVFIEHLSTEFNRALNMMQHPLAATVVLFLRSASWVLFVLPLMYFEAQWRHLDILLGGWLFGGVLSILFGIWFLSKHMMVKKNFKLDTTWILRGYKVGMIFFLGTLSLQAITLLDKFWLKYLSGEAMVGVYTFYWTLVLGMTAFIHAGMIVFLSPKIVKAFQEKQFDDFNALLSQFLKELAVASVFMVVVLFSIMPIVVEWVGKEIYTEHYHILYLLGVTGVFIVLTNHPHTFLYAARKDKYMLLANISALLIFISGMFVMKQMEGYTAIEQVTLVMMGTYGWMLGIKSLGYLYYRKEYL